MKSVSIFAGVLACSLAIGFAGCKKEDTAAPAPNPAASGSPSSDLGESADTPDTPEKEGSSTDPVPTDPAPSDDPETGSNDN
jgi:hypothetical protein